MRHGADWYKRDPGAFLGGVQGLTAAEHAVYSVTLDLIYMHGGSINNDPKWIAGWISDMGAAAVRNTIASLVARGKLELDGEEITQKVAKNQAKTKEKLAENRAEIGRKGGENSGFSRRQSSKNNDLSEANASEKSKQIREEKIRDSISNEILAETAPRDGVPEAVEAYNAAAHRQGWPAVQKLNEARRKALKLRLKDCGGIEGWGAAMAKAEASDFLCARTAKPWNGFGFDWLTKAANFTKLMEGNYDNRASQAAAPAPGSSEAFLRSVARAAGSF